MKPSALVKKAYRLARQTQKHAHAPYSHFLVGAGVVSGKKIFSGCNVENASYGGTVCAERVALFKGVSEGARRFSDVVVVTNLAQPAFPCAMCLQVMSEFCGPQTRVWVGNGKRLHEMVVLGELYPKAFGAADLHRAGMSK